MAVAAETVGSGAAGGGVAVRRLLVVRAGDAWRGIAVILSLRQFPSFS